MKLLMDIWGGERHLEFLARYIFDGSAREFIATQAMAELQQGYLVNLRCLDYEKVPWGPEQEFDLRRGGMSS